MQWVALPRSTVGSSVVKRAQAFGLVLLDLPRSIQAPVVHHSTACGRVLDLPDMWDGEVVTNAQTRYGGRPTSSTAMREMG